MLNKFNNSSLNDIEWISIKFPFIVFICSTLLTLIFGIDKIIINRGICLLINCDFLLFPYIKLFTSSFIIVFCIFYTFEIKMLFTTFFLAIISFCIFSVHESSGVSARTGVLTLILFFQFISYLIYHLLHNKKALNINRISFSIQVLVAGYTLSAISKLYTSGLTWFTDGRNIALQILKSNQMKHLDGITYHSSYITDKKISFITENEWLIVITLFSALTIEFLSALALLDKRYRIYIGIALLLMHLGIYIIMEIMIFSFAIPMVIFMINPFYLLFNVAKNKLL